MVCCKRCLKLLNEKSIAKVIKIYLTANKKWLFCLLVLLRFIASCYKKIRTNYFNSFQKNNISFPH